MEQKGDLAKTLVEVRSTDNAWSSEHNDLVPVGSSLTKTCHDCYWIAPEILLANQRYARDRGLAIIGVYHSHPDHPAIPSKFDQDLAWPQYSYMIVSVQNGVSQNLSSWTLDQNHRFQPESTSIIESVGSLGN
jgi:proteasome lid subunit RPN8/RPN11